MSPAIFEIITLLTEITIWNSLKEIFIFYVLEHNSISGLLDIICNWIFHILELIFSMTM